MTAWKNYGALKEFGDKWTQAKIKVHLKVHMNGLDLPTGIPYSQGFYKSLSLNNHENSLNGLRVKIKRILLGR